MNLEFKIFTLNCWGLAVVSKNRRHRIQAISEFLANSHYDVVCLQEIWTDRDFYLIKNEVFGVLPYSHYFYSGVAGSGLCVFSKYVIEEAFFHQWPVNGYFHKIHHGDWFGGKGVGLCKLSVNNFSVNIYTAHLHAEYNRNNDEYEAHRILQAYDTAQFILLTSQGADLIVLAGDLNTSPGDLAYRVIKGVPGLLDSFECCNEVPNDDVATCDSLRNSYTSRDAIKKKKSGQRIDYIMFHPGSKLRVELQNYKLPLPDRVSNCSYSYSDHEAVEATLQISNNVALDPLKYDDTVKTALHDCLLVLNRSLDTLVTVKIYYIVFFLLLLGALIISFGFEVPVNYSILYNFLRLVVTVASVFCFLMGIIWNKIEKHGILATKLSIEKALKKKSSL